MKKIISLLLSALLIFGLNACSSKDSGDSGSGSSDEASPAVTEMDPATITVAVPQAPPALPVLYMIENKVLGENITIDLKTWDEPEMLIAMVQDGQHDLFAFPLTVVSKLYNKGMDVQLMNVNTWGVTYFMTSDPDFQDWSDLAGKTVYIPLQSSPPDALTQYFLNEAGLKVGEDVNIVYASTAEVATLLISGEAEYATLIEPQVTRALMANENLRVALSFEDEWQRVNDTTTMIPNAGFGATGSFIENNPELAALFQSEYEKALVWIKENPEEAGQLAEKYLGLKSQLVAKALPGMGLTFKTALDSKEELDMFYQMLYDFDPSMIGANIPDDGMYYVE